MRVCYVVLIALVVRTAEGSTTISVAPEIAVPDTLSDPLPTFESLFKALTHSETKHALQERHTSWHSHFSYWLESATKGSGESFESVPMPTRRMFPVPMPNCSEAVVGTMSTLCWEDRRMIRGYCGVLQTRLLPFLQDPSHYATSSLVLLETAGEALSVGCSFRGIGMAAEALVRLSQALAIDQCKDEMAAQWPHQWQGPVFSAEAERLQVLYFLRYRVGSSLRLPVSSIWWLGSVLVLEASEALTWRFLFLSITEDVPWYREETGHKEAPKAFPTEDPNILLSVLVRACGTLAYFEQYPPVYFRTCPRLTSLLLSNDYLYRLALTMGSLGYRPMSVYQEGHADRPFQIHGRGYYYKPKNLWAKLALNSFNETICRLWKVPLALPLSLALPRPVEASPQHRYWSIIMFLFGFKGFPGQVVAEFDPGMLMRWGHDLQALQQVIPSAERGSPTRYDSVGAAFSQTALIPSMLRFAQTVLNGSLRTTTFLQSAWDYSQLMQLQATPGIRGLVPSHELRLLHRYWLEERQRSGGNIALDKTSETEENNEGFLRQSVRLDPLAELVLVTEFYLSTAPERNAELQSTLLANLRHAGIGCVVARVDTESSREALWNLLQQNATEAERLKVIVRDEIQDPVSRPRVQSLLQGLTDVWKWFPSTIGKRKSVLVAIANADIRFSPNAVNNLIASPLTERLLQQAVVVSLTRWPVSASDHGAEKGILSYTSQDTWVFRYPMRPPLDYPQQYYRCVESLRSWPELSGREEEFCEMQAPQQCLNPRGSLPCTPARLDFELGRLGSDMRMNWVFWTMGYTVLNPVYHVVTHHEHRTQIRNKDYFRQRIGPPGIKAFWSFVDDMPIDPFVYEVLDAIFAQGDTTSTTGGQ